MVFISYHAAEILVAWGFIAGLIVAVSARQERKRLH